MVRATELLADELRPQGIRVNCVLPSVIDTPANRSWMSADLAARAVAPAAIARVIAFLIGPDAVPVSGARVPSTVTPDRCAFPGYGLKRQGWPGRRATNRPSASAHSVPPSRSSPDRNRLRPSSRPNRAVSCSSRSMGVMLR